MIAVHYFVLLHVLTLLWDSVWRAVYSYLSQVSLYNEESIRLLVLMVKVELFKVDFLTILTHSKGFNCSFSTTILYADSPFVMLKNHAY